MQGLQGLQGRGHEAGYSERNADEHHSLEPIFGNLWSWEQQHEQLQGPFQGRRQLPLQQPRNKGR